MLLAELEVWHNRPLAPTRRIALGNLVLPVDPAPGFGGLLLGAVVTAHIADVSARIGPRRPPADRPDRPGRAGRPAAAAPSLPGRPPRPRPVDASPARDPQRDQLRPPRDRHRSRPGARRDLRRRAARPGEPPPRHSGPAPRHALAGTGGPEVHRPPRRHQHRCPVHPRRSPRLGARCPRLRPGNGDADAQGGHRPSSGPRCAPSIPITAAITTWPAPPCSSSPRPAAS